MKDFSNETEAELITEFAAAEKDGNQEKKKALTEEALLRINA